MTGEGKHCTESEGAGMKEYIERAAVEEMLESAQIISDGEYCGYCTEYINLSSIPAADVAPVRHARWIKHEGYDECEACHVKAIYGYNYCPNCGSRMDK